MRNWGRLITAMVTPFDEELNVNYSEAVKLAQKLQDEGSSALVVCGTAGEAPTLTSDEKVKLLKTIKENVTIPVIAEVGTNSTSTAIENSRKALECGVDGLLIVVPYCNKPDQESIYEHFKTAANAVDGNIMICNTPGRTGCNMLPETLGELCKIKNIIAIKETSDSIVQLSEMVRRSGDDFRVYTGDDALTLPALSVGGYGIVSVASNLVGRSMKEMIDSYLEGDVIKASSIHLELLDIYDKLSITTNPIPVKAALNMAGIKAGGLRLPLVEASPAIKAEIQRSLRNLNLV